MDGPTPKDGGKTEACSLHIGITELGNTFDQAYLDFFFGIMQPYREFLNHVTGKWMVMGDWFAFLTICSAFSTTKESLRKMSPKLVLEASLGPMADVITSSAGTEAQAPIPAPALCLTSGICR